MPKSDAICGRVSPLVVAMRTASRLNSSLYLSAISYLLHCEYRSKETGTKSGQVQRLALAFAFSLAVAALFAAGAVARFATFETALELRGEIMEVSWLLAWQRPWVGVGSLDLTLQAVAPASWPALVQSAHNVVVESFVERGAPATIVAVVALVLVMGQCARSIRSSAAGRVVNAAAFGVATIVLLHGMVDFSVQSPTIAALVAIVLGLGAGCAKAPASVSPIGLARGNPYAGARA
jgi:hypothetical protein